MKLALSISLAAASFAVSPVAVGTDDICEFSSIKDFMADEGAVFAVKGIRLDFHEKAGSNAYRAFLISPCRTSPATSCFSAAYFSFGVPKSPVALGESWEIAGETYAYEENVETSVLGRTERFGVISRRVGGKLKSKFLVNDARGLSAILFFSDVGRADYQVYLQGDSCHPFPIHLSKAPAVETGNMKSR